MARSGTIAALYDRFLRKHPKQSRSRHVVEAVLAAAGELASEDEEVTIQDVAQRAGVGIGSVYDYFDDRESIFSSFAAKITEDNLRRFRTALSATRDKPLSEAVSSFVDLAFDTYLTDKRVPRVALRIAHRVGLMPTVAAMQARFAGALAEELRARGSALPKDDLEVTAFVATNIAMGVVHNTLWLTPSPYDDDRLRAEVSRAVAGYIQTAAASAT